MSYPRSIEAGLAVGGLIFETWIDGAFRRRTPVPGSCLEQVDQLAADDASYALEEAAGRPIRIVVYDGDDGEYVFDCAPEALRPLVSDRKPPS